MALFCIQSNGVGATSKFSVLYTILLLQIKVCDVDPLNVMDSFRFTVEVFFLPKK